MGQQEAAFMAFAQMRSLREVRSGDLVAGLKLSAKQEQDLLSRMTQRGLIAQVRRGLYLVPARLPLGGIWTPNDATAINALMADQQARYQITGPSAFTRYGYEDQIPSRITIYNNTLSTERTIGQTNLTLVKVGDDRLGDTEQATTSSGETLLYASRTRTLVDAVYDWSRFDSLPRAYDWIRREVDAERVALTDLAQATICYGNVGTIRRMGALLEQMNAGEPILKQLQRAIKPTSAKIPFVPGEPTRGTLMKRWRVVLNA